MVLRGMVLVAVAFGPRNVRDGLKREVSCGHGPGSLCSTNCLLALGHPQWSVPWSWCCGCLCPMPWLWCCTDVVHFLEPGFNWLSRKRAWRLSWVQKDGRTWVAAAPIAWSFMFSSLSPLHLRAWMHVSSQGVWNGETQTCDVHSCSLQERINLRFQSFHEDASSWKVYKFGQKRTNSRFYSFHGAVPMQ